MVSLHYAFPVLEFVPRDDIPLAFLFAALGAGVADADGLSVYDLDVDRDLLRRLHGAPSLFIVCRIFTGPVCLFPTRSVSPRSRRVA